MYIHVYVYIYIYTHRARSCFVTSPGVSPCCVVHKMVCQCTSGHFQPPQHSVNRD